VGTKSQYRVTLSVNGVDYGVWDKKTGGDVQATITKHRPGGMGDEETYGGQPETTDVVLTRVKKRRDRDDIAKIRTLRTLVGIARAVVVEQPLDQDKNAWGDPTVYNGVVMRVSGADVDSTANDPDLYEVGISTNGNVA
jgi:hypothetical protein